MRAADEGPACRRGPDSVLTPVQLLGRPSPCCAELLPAELPGALLRNAGQCLRVRLRLPVHQRSNAAARAAHGAPRGAVHGARAAPRLPGVCHSQGRAACMAGRQAGRTAQGSACGLGTARGCAQSRRGCPAGSLACLPFVWPHHAALPPACRCADVARCGGAHPIPG